MSLDNGRGNRRCANCKRWQNERSHPANVLVKMGDCDLFIFPVITGVSSQGPQMLPGGTYNITLADSYCSFGWAPKLSVLAGFKNDAMDVAATPLQPPKESA